MRSYECAVIFAPSVADQDLQTGARKYINVIADNGGELTRVETWGRRRLAYEIDHHAEGHYFFFHFRGTTAVVNELDRQLKIDERIIRHMVIRDELASGSEPTVAAGAIEIARTSEAQEVDR